MQHAHCAEVGSQTAVATPRAGRLRFLVVVRLRSGGQIGFVRVGGSILRAGVTFISVVQPVCWYVYNSLAAVTRAAGVQTAVASDRS